MAFDPYKDPGLKGKVAYWLSWSFGFAVFHLYNRVSIKGAGHVPTSGPVLVVSNHCSSLDPPIVGCSTVRRRFNFMAKAELFESGNWFARYIWMLGAFPVKRGAGDAMAYKHSVSLLREGKVLLLFPEGTRSPDGTLQAFEVGAARMALSAPGIQVLPARVRGNFEAMPKGRSFPKPAKLRVHFGEPFKPEEMDMPEGGKKALYRAVADQMFNRISQL